MGGYIEEREGLERIRKPKEEEVSVEGELLSRLNPLIEDRFIVEVIRPIKAGKEAVVYCCRAHPSLERELVAAKIFRPPEMRSFKKDGIYRQGREHMGPVDVRLLRALAKKTRGGKLRRFNAWISHEMRTLEILHRAGADVPEPIERYGPVILMEYIGDDEAPAPVLVGVTLDQDEARGIYKRVLENVDLFLANNRVHADLSAYNILYSDGRGVIIDFPQAVDPRYNQDAFDLLIRDIKNLNGYFKDYDLELVDPFDHALALWRKHVDPFR